MPKRRKASPRQKLTIRCLICDKEIDTWWKSKVKYKRVDIKVSIMRGDDHVVHFCEEHMGQKLTDHAMLELEPDAEKRHHALNKAKRLSEQQGP